MGKIIKNNVTYGGVPDEVITAWETEDVQDLSEIEYGDADISDIGDGSITGAIAEHEDNINDIDEAIGNTNISSIGDGTVTGAISTLNSKLALHDLSSGDLNNYKGADATGFYYIRTGVANAPLDWCWMLVIGGPGTVQIVFVVNGIRIRAYTGTPLAWTSWRSISAT